MTVRAVVIGATRKGFFLQDLEGPADGETSCGLFVFSPREKPDRGSVVEVVGEVVEYRGDEFDRSTTQLVARSHRQISRESRPIEPQWLDAELVALDGKALAEALRRLEGMLVGIPKGSVFIAPSNPFGDYVVLPPGAEGVRTAAGGVRGTPERPDRWYPSFRILDYSRAPRVDVGSELLDPVVGPLNYRSASFQVAANRVPRVHPSRIVVHPTTLASDPQHLRILTLNGFNLDPHVERPDRVMDPRRDIDDDVGDGRYDMLAGAVVDAAGSPEIVALQEIQDDDGAEMTARTSARKNYQTLIRAIRRLGGPSYRWAEIRPEAEADGGQPGGNIRNAFLYDPDRVECIDATLRRIGEDHPAFVDSRKVLAARFHHLPSGHEIEVFNVHLASKRHQRSLFAPERPGFDPREETRIAQAGLVADELDRLDAAGIDYYVAGDFNDFESSASLARFCTNGRVNLANRIEESERFDYNHRGLSQALMHGIVSAERAAAGNAEYEILHGNELFGTQPGELGDRATDHAYVIARIEV